MKHLIVSVIATILVVAAGTGILRSHSFSTNGQGATAGISIFQEMQGSTDKLPAEDFEDRSLVYPREVKR